MNDKQQIRVSQDNSLFRKNVKLSLNGDEIKIRELRMVVDTVKNIFECKYVDENGLSSDLSTNTGMFFLNLEVGPYLIKGKTNDATEYSLIFRTSNDNNDSSGVSVFATRAEIQVSKDGSDSVNIENIFIAK